VEHKLEIGSSSIVGQTMSQGRHFSSLYTLSAGGDVHRFNPLLPLTRSEIAMPLRIGDQIIGVLDLQSVEPNAYDDEDVQVFQMMADQIAIAVNNARLFEKSEEARHIADEANRQKSEFLSNMSHELRTPLNVIIGYSHSMLHRPTMYENVALPSSYTSAVESIMVSGQHLLGLINDILDLSKIEAGRIELDIRPTNVWPILEGVRTTTLGLLKSGVKLRADYAANLPPVMVDELRFRQIVLNLVSNAAKFTEQGFITMDAAIQGDSIVFSVADTGTGISEDAKSVIFGRYRQASSEIARKVGGTGLGLNICQQLTTMHGGKIWFDSVAGQGSTFYFSIPLAPDSIEAITPVLMTSGRVGDGSIAQIFDEDEDPTQPVKLLSQLLIIDTNSETRATLENALNEANFNVLSTDNPDRALNIASMLVPDVILIHLHADDSEAMKTLAWSLHKDDNLSDVNILVLDERRPDTNETGEAPDLAQRALQLVQAKLTA
jgi:signal transduction histidine kinase